MTYPLLRGRRVKEIVVPKKSVEQYTCERCAKIWYEDSVVEVAKLTVSMRLSNGTLVGDSYDVLCSGCEKTAVNYARGLIKKMVKASPAGRKNGAKEKGAEAPSSPPGDPKKTSGTAVVEPPTRGASHPPRAAGSDRPSK